MKQLCRISIKNTHFKNIRKRRVNDSLFKSCQLDIEGILSSVSKVTSYNRSSKFGNLLDSYTLHVDGEISQLWLKTHAIFGLFFSLVRFEISNLYFFSLKGYDFFLLDILVIRYRPMLK